MEKIKVNDYLRTKEHGIFKVLKFVKTSYGYYWGINDKRKAFSIGKGGNLEVDITKHSSNILDLIEVGDYVNEQKMKEFYVEENPVTKNKRLVIKHEWLKIINDFEIKSIVTREQFESIKYRLE